MDYGERYHNLTVCSEGVGGKVGHGAGGTRKVWRVGGT